MALIGVVLGGENMKKVFRFVLPILIVFSIMAQAREHDGIEKVGQLYDYWDRPDAVVQDNIAYIYCSSGLRIIDLTDRDLPNLIGSWEDNPTRINCCIVRGDIIYAVDYLGWLYVLNVQNPSTPILFHRY